MHPSVDRAARAVLDEVEPVVALLLPSLPIIIPWATRVNTISAEEDIAYNEGITGSHFGEGGIDQMRIPLQVSSDIIEVLKLSTVAFLVCRTLIWSWISVPSAYRVRLSASWACDFRMSVLFLHLL